MKKELLKALSFSVMIVSFNAFLVASIWRQNDIKETDGAAQVESTNLAKNLVHSIKSKHSINIITNFAKVSVENHCKLEESYTGWTVGNVNVRNIPSIGGEVIKTLPFNTPVQYYKYNDEWVKVISEDGIVYIHTDCLSDSKCKYIDYDVYDTKGFKSYMPYTAITSTSSPQYKLQQIAYTGNYGLRQVEDRYCVAIGTAFNAPIGTYFDIILTNETVIRCVVSDIKANEHTDSFNVTTVANGCMSEFLVDMNALDSHAKRMGNVSVFEDWDSTIETIRVYDKNVFTE